MSSSIQSSPTSISRHLSSDMRTESVKGNSDQASGNIKAVPTNMADREKILDAIGKMEKKIDKIYNILDRGDGDDRETSFKTSWSDGGLPISEAKNVGEALEAMKKSIEAIETKLGRAAAPEGRDKEVLEQNSQLNKTHKYSKSD